MRFLKSGTIYTVANIASAGVPFALLPLLTRVLTPAQYGQVVSFTLLVTLSQAIAGFNAHGALGVIYFRRPTAEIPDYTGTAVLLAIASSLMVGPVIAAILYIFPWIAEGLDPVWGIAAAITAGSIVILQCRLVLWQSQHKAILAASLQFASSVLNLGLSLVAVLILMWAGTGRNAAIAASAMMMAAIALVLLIQSGELRWNPKREHFETLTRFGAPLIAHTLGAVMLSSADRWAVAIKLEEHALGIYGAGAQLGMTMVILGDAFVKAYAPWVYAKLRTERAEDNLSAVGAVYATIPLFILVAGCLGLILYFASSALLGPSYEGAASVLPWFMLGGAFNGIYLATSSLYFYHGRTGLLAMVTLGSGSTGAIISMMLVSKLGLQGAAIGYAITQIILGYVAMTVAMRSFDLPWTKPGAALRHWARGLVESGPAREPL